MGYADQEATRAALAQADRHRKEANRLHNAIVEHYKQIHQHNWSADDALWDEVGLMADPEVIG
jgi:hypothetical protein